MSANNVQSRSQFQSKPLLVGGGAGLALFTTIGLTALLLNRFVPTSFSHHAVRCLSTPWKGAVAALTLVGGGALIGHCCSSASVELGQDEPELMPYEKAMQADFFGIKGGDAKILRYVQYSEAGKEDREELIATWSGQSDLSAEELKVELKEKFEMGRYQGISMGPKQNVLRHFGLSVTLFQAGEISNTGLVAAANLLHRFENEREEFFNLIRYGDLFEEDRCKADGEDRALVTEQYNGGVNSLNEALLFFREVLPEAKKLERTNAIVIDLQRPLYGFPEGFRETAIKAEWEIATRQDSVMAEFALRATSPLIYKSEMQEAIDRIEPKLQTITGKEYKQYITGFKGTVEVADDLEVPLVHAILARRLLIADDAKDYPSAVKHLTWAGIYEKGGLIERGVTKQDIAAALKLAKGIETE